MRERAVSVCGGMNCHAAGTKCLRLPARADYSEDGISSKLCAGANPTIRESKLANFPRLSSASFTKYVSLICLYPMISLNCPASRCGRRSQYSCFSRAMRRSNRLEASYGVTASRVKAGFEESRMNPSCVMAQVAQLFADFFHQRWAAS